MEHHLIWDHSSKLSRLLVSKALGDMYSLPTSEIIKQHIDEFKRLEEFEFNQEKVFVYEAATDLKLSELQWVNLKDLSALKKEEGLILCQTLARFWKGMPQAFSDRELNSLLYKIDQDQEVVFYGGSFNPWHDGHRACLDLCPSNNIIVVPDYNPWKDQNQPGVSDKCRWSTFKELMLTLEKTPYSLYPGFWGIQNPNPTSTWLPATSFSKKSLLMGDDSFFSLLNWINSEVLLKSLTSVYVAPRNHALSKIKEQKEEITKLYPSLDIQILKEHSFQELSSSKLREEL